MNRNRMYDTPEIEFTKFEVEKSIMIDFVTHPNEGDGETVTWIGDSIPDVTQDDL